jgi:aminopeptidase N
VGSTACTSLHGPPPTPGAATAGDPYFPLQGNGGYDAVSYRIALTYSPQTKRLDGTATITARATKALSRFDLDLRSWLHASEVTVDRQRAHVAARRGQELVITPAQPLTRGSTFTTVVRYGGPARHLIAARIPTGFIVTADGAFVGNEPDGAPTWFPVNDTPRDKATYTVAVTVPKTLVAVSNGSLFSSRISGDLRTWTWHIRQPIPSYLVTATIGRFTISRGRTGSGIPYFTAINGRQPHAIRSLRALPAIIDYFSSVYGPYPFDSTGAIFDDAFVGYALEVASRPLFDRSPGELVLAHELAHQWFGDDVTLARWRDIWLNEGFAEFSTWLWDEHRGRESAAAHLRALLREPAGLEMLWDPPPGDPGSVKRVFSESVYERGAGALEALRQRLGDGEFFRILRGWVQVHRFGNATVPEFVRYAERISGRDLTHFFAVWLYRRGKPAGW